VELETGGIDLMDELPVAAAARLEATRRITVHRLRGRYFGHLQWNLRRPQFTDRRVRRALSLALDRESMVQRLLHGYGAPAASPIPPALWAHHPTLRPDPYDPAAARKLLAEAGWEDRDGDGIREREGVALQFTLTTRKDDPVRENAAIIIRENLRSVGVSVQIRALEMSTVLDEVRRGRFDAHLGLFSSRLAVDPSALLRSTATDRFNYGSYGSAEVDSLLDLGLSIADRARARPVWYRLQEVVAADAPIALLYYPDLLVGVGPRLRGVRPHILSPYNNITEWWIGDEPPRDSAAPPGGR
jgi:peptide/nickel transport system substrate-binding protein